jgi:Arc/MetJ-type ribon-helix-helix transcriptional regulator
MSKSPKTTIRVSQSTLDELDALVDDGVYRNRSEAIRDGAHRILDAHGVQVDEPEPDMTPGALEADSNA